MEKYIVDRFEGDFIVLESEKGGTIDVERVLLPDVREGDVLVKSTGGYTIDAAETQKRKVLLEEKLKKLLKKH